MKVKIIMVMAAVLLFSTGSLHAQWVVSDPTNFAGEHRQHGQGDCHGIEDGAEHPEQLQGNREGL